MSAIKVYRNFQQFVSYVMTIRFKAGRLQWTNLW
jgi:hypothetical protein